MHKYIIMGIQGSGKGKQSRLLAQDLQLVHISLGEIFRWHLDNHTKLAARIRQGIDAGEFVPDSVVQDLVRRRLEEHDWNYGFILDGFPRNRPQADFFLESYDVDAVIHIDVPDDVVLERLVARRHCSQCGKDYNLKFSPPKQPGICDACGGELQQRSDDTAPAIQARFESYHRVTEPVLDLFRQKSLVVDVDGAPAPEIVHANLRKALNLRPQTPGDA